MYAKEEMKKLKFDMRFYTPVKDGLKRNTIRRKTVLTEGECVKLVAIQPKAGGAEYFDIKVVMITSIIPVLIDYERRAVSINNVMLEPEQVEELFKDNGWEDIKSGFEYYKSMYGKIFEGVSIQWD